MMNLFSLLIVKIVQSNLTTQLSFISVMPSMPSIILEKVELFKKGGKKLTIEYAGLFGDLFLMTYIFSIIFAVEGFYDQLISLIYHDIFNNNFDENSLIKQINISTSFSIMNNNLLMLKYLNKKNLLSQHTKNKDLELAASRNDLLLVKYFISIGADPFNPRVITHAQEMKSEKVLQYLNSLKNSE